MKKILLSVLLGSVFAATSASALENTVKPKVTQLGVESPKTGLLVGNSYSFSLFRNLRENNTSKFDQT